MEKIKVGIAGLGRLGKVHAHNLAYKIPNACLKAACSIVPAELEYAKKRIGCYGRRMQDSRKSCRASPGIDFFLGFMRRFDPSYAYAKQKIREGVIGTPYMVKAAGIDPEELVEGTIRFASTSGGIFIDMAIHDIDLMR